MATSLQTGIDVVWETVGGAVFETLFNHLALGGRLVIVGAISGYKTVGFPQIQTDNLAVKVSGEVLLSPFVLHDKKESLLLYTVANEQVSLADWLSLSPL